MVRIISLGWCLVLVGCAPDPYFESVLELSDTFDTVGPYRIEAYVAAPQNVSTLSLMVFADSGAEEPAEPEDPAPWFELAQGDRHRGRWVYDLPGRPAGSVYSYYLVLEDTAGLQALYPKGAPTNRLGFEIFGPE